MLYRVPKRLPPYAHVKQIQEICTYPEWKGIIEIECLSINYANLIKFMINNGFSDKDMYICNKIEILKTSSRKK
jgi:hypothetical protein